MPDVGETRSANGETRTWDGTAWRLATAAPSQGVASSLESIASPAGREGLLQYGKDLLTGQGTARHDVADYAKKEGSGFVSTVNPINQVKGVLRMLTTDPRTTLSGMADTATAALSGDPTAVGNVLGMVVAPKADAAILRGVNTAAQAVADSPKLQGSAGYIGGAAGGIVTGQHPFIMGRIGQAASPIIGSAARGVANVTGKVMDTFGMDRAGALPKEFDRYAPNSSGYDPREPPVMSDTPDLPRGIAQGVYTQLPDGSWGVQALPGFTLADGEPVNVMNRAGHARVFTVGKVGPDGITAVGDAAPPSEAMFSAGSRLSEAVRQKIMEKLQPK